MWRNIFLLVKYFRYIQCERYLVLSLLRLWCRNIIFAKWMSKWAIAHATKETLSHPASVRLYIGIGCPVPRTYRILWTSICLWCDVMGFDGELSGANISVHSNSTLLNKTVRRNEKRIMWWLNIIWVCMWVFFFFCCFALLCFASATVLHVIMQIGIHSNHQWNWTDDV